MVQVTAEKELKNLFRCLGLTLHDAEVYVILLARGPMTLTEVAKELEKHRPQVYESLERLKVKGLVEVSEGKPTLYRAVKPEVLSSIFEEEVRSFKENALKYLKNIERKAPPPKEYVVWMLRSYKGLMRRFHDTTKQAQIDLAVCGGSRFLKNIIEDLIDAQKRGVCVYVIAYEVPGEALDLDLLKPLKKVKIAVSGDLMIVRDSEQAVLAQRRLGARVKPSYGLLIEEPVLIDYLLHDFFNRWIRSKPYRDEAVSLPVSFTIFRIAILEAMRLMEKGVKLWARLEGRWVETSEEGVLEGRVVDVVMDMTTGLTHFVIESEGSRVRAGGPDAVVEEFAAKKILLDEVR
ncbi:MAG TPA: TrmB family transcriptional regulator [Thermoprotei archaeon]|nr:TrmB family transcriptional regulator [Thermoprotei archaeon]